MLKTTPAVFAVGTNYQIMVPVDKPSLFWVTVGDRTFYDEQNGIMRTLCSTHRVTVPMDLLNKAELYTVYEREIIDKKPYFPETKEPTAATFEFRPIPNDNVRVYHMADTHNTVTAPVKAAEVFGDIDLLIMNGDIPDHSGDIANYDTIYEIIEKLTAGGKPVVFARGNHDLRGYFAEQMADHTPSENGNTFYTFRLGAIWGIILDCGEDKDDSHPEYGHTVCCHSFRERQIDFIESVIKNKDTEYGADGVKYKMVVCHNPFTYIQEAPFDIEKDVFGKWASLLKTDVKPDVMLSGHIHGMFISRENSEYDHLGQPCTVIVGSDIKENYHAGCGLVLKGGHIESAFVDSDGNVTEKTDIL
ncbi:MAG: metallophosphoesterase [Clostridia bacterium]|nr:metallophosphoesterase [Clostridia bacterium]